MNTRCIAILFSICFFFCFFNVSTHLVRFGGAGACLPRLFVVRLICTLALPLVENVLNFDVVEQSE